MGITRYYSLIKFSSSVKEISTNLFLELMYA